MIIETYMATHIASHMTFIAELARRGCRKLRWSAMPATGRVLDQRVEPRKVPLDIRRAAKTMLIAATVRRCSDCGWELPRFGCPHEGCNGVALHTRGATLTTDHHIAMKFRTLRTARGAARSMGWPLNTVTPLAEHVWTDRCFVLMDVYGRYLTPAGYADVQQ